MDVFAKITGIAYTPFLCRELNTYNIKDLDNAFDHDASFILSFDKGIKIAISWWVSAKRTRSYPYSRVYDTLSFQGKKATIIPIVKDEGKEGDRDFLQWDTISLMSLLGVYTIVSYYNRADKSTRYEHKITNQRFDIKHLQSNFANLLSYQSDPLHWNLSQIENIGVVGKKALAAYKIISQKQKIVPILKLTSDVEFSADKLSSSKIKMLKLLSKESSVNKFQVLLNGKKIHDYQPLVEKQQSFTKKR